MKKYYVTLMAKYDEFYLLVTTDIEKAIERAKNEAHYIERDKRKNDAVEIRAYVEDIEDEDCTNFDFDTIDF